ncbi:hypothetical protein F2Q69_00045762 [Brassica cretica]|uniref:DNA-directed RNA polymerase n=1 Tax=Brassica cretica TaxID=69181 RepID=A0A8S9NAT5_BRACR|nr:hypothetical protein F2Q69_00045762 [Brassica cretica]
MAVMGHENLSVIVAETGWPSSGIDYGEDDATLLYSEMFLKGLLAHLRSGGGTKMMVVEGKEEDWWRIGGSGMDIRSKARTLYATPFRDAVKKTNGEEDSKSSLLVDDHGSMLKQKGFNHYVTDTLYSGYLGVELKYEKFMGPVYYQRLRHMVSDKFQVRSTGMVDQLTRQPIKGRRRGGGIRFGEMERDSLLAHGASYLLHDRLHTSSDHHIADVCSLCGSLLTSSVLNVQQKKLIREIGNLPPGRTPKKVTCASCKTSKGMETVAMPYVFRYLAAELASMNIKMTIGDRGCTVDVSVAGGTFLLHPMLK